ncbi:hypothetical protein HY025_04470 [Candidatus Daviesbacteria bacterium]|nr:hypothetical protein [Candidatus Daviesbacteria bacterium]
MKIVIILLPFLIGLLIGFFSHDHFKENLETTFPSFQQVKSNFDLANNLRVDINSVYRENVILLTSSLRRIYNKEPFAPDALEALSENTEDIGDIIGKYYGVDIRSEYVQRWTNQNHAYITYTEAVRDKDNDKKIIAEADLNNYLESSLSFWKRVNPSFDTIQYKTMLSSRINFIKNFINDLSSSNITDSYKEQHNAYQQNGKIADFLTLAIVKQFPEKFK